MSVENSAKDLGVMPAKGFRDLMPAETLVRDQLVSTIIETYRAYGFERIETPAVEDIRRLTQSEGGENLSLLFKILKRGEKLDLSRNSEDELVDLGLRYDLTVPLARFYANNKAKLPPVFKSIQLGPVWRAERPQKGRFRQFTQCDIDIIGGSTPGDEIELITVTLDVLGKFQICNATVRVNDRRLLTQMVEYAGIPSEQGARALIAFDKIDKVGIKGVQEIMTQEGFDPKAVEKFINFVQKIEALPSNERLGLVSSQFASALGQELFNNMQQIISATSAVASKGIRVEFDPFLVRGMGYYTGAVFEVVVADFSGSVAGGGRYDKLIGKLSGNDAPACGFSIGFERLATILEGRKSELISKKKIALVYSDDIASFEELIKYSKELQGQGMVASIFKAPKNLKNFLERLKQADYTNFVNFKNDEKPLIKDIV